MSKHPIPYGRHWVDDRDIRSVAAVLRSERLTQGPKVEEFEKRFAEQCQAKYAVAVSNGTAALHLAYLAVGLARGGEVITSPITFVATANAALFAGGRPVFADVDPETLNLDPDACGARVTRRTQALVPVHFAGAPCDMKAFRRLADKTGAAVVEDACHALGAIGDGGPVGSCRYSDAAVFSFHPVKSITTGEGGMITTGSKTIHQVLLDLRSHGMIRGERRLRLKDPWAYEIHRLGFNYRLTDIQSALGIEQLKKLKKFIRLRRNIAEEYLDAFRGNSDVSCPPERFLSTSSWHLFVIRIQGSHAAAKRRFLYDELTRRGILVQVHYVPIHQQPFYRSMGHRADDCPRSEQAYQGILSLPIYPLLAPRRARFIAGQVREILAGFGKKR